MIYKTIVLSITEHRSETNLLTAMLSDGWRVITSTSINRAIAMCGSYGGSQRGDGHVSYVLSKQPDQDMREPSQDPFGYYSYIP